MKAMKEIIQHFKNRRAERWQNEWKLAAACAATGHGVRGTNPTLGALADTIQMLTERLLSWLAGAKRSGVAQPCPPSPTCSAPERSGGAEEVGDYLRRSAPVKRSAEGIEQLIDSAAENLPELWEIRIVVQREYAEVIVTRPDGSDVPMQDGESDMREQFRNALCLIRDELEADKMLATSADSGQRSAPKAESAAPDEGGSGAQARNGGVERQP